MFTSLVDWFFSLSLGQAAFLVALVSILVGSFAYSFINEFIMQGGYDKRQLVLDTCDEFEFKDDPYAEINKPLDLLRRIEGGWDIKIDPMRDDIHTVKAKERILSGAPQIDPSHCTCTKCAQQHVCAFAFDAYNLDGDCLMTK
jgi:hypothetical protein